MKRIGVVLLFGVMLPAQTVLCAEFPARVSSEAPDLAKQAEVKRQVPSLGGNTALKKPLTPPPYLQSLESTNEFDRQRQLWPDRVPPPPPPLPPPPPTPITDQDVQLYGVVIVGQTKRATVKYGPRFASLNTSGKPFVTISEGQAIGEYTLTGIKPTHLVLTAPGGQQQLSFNRKMDRAVGPGGGGQVVSAGSGSNETDPNVSASPQNQSQASTSNDGAGKLPGTGAQASTNLPPVGNPENALKNPAPGSLAAAIVAAQAAAQSPAPQTPSTPPPANFNPFLQLFPKQ